MESQNREPNHIRGRKEGEIPQERSHLVELTARLRRGLQKIGDIGMKPGEIWRRRDNQSALSIILGFGQIQIGRRNNIKTVKVLHQGRVVIHSYDFFAHHWKRVET